MANLVESEPLNSSLEEVELRNRDEKLKTRELDRISDLPDDIVSLILSLLTTKQAVATSVLSKRWQSIWTLAPDLDFSSRFSAETESFLRFFMDRVKRLKKSFGVVRLQGRLGYHLEDLVRQIMDSNVRELDVYVVLEAPIEFHHGLLTSKTLVSLKLNRISFPLELSVHLPCLRILHILQIGKISEGSIKEIISGCPVLEDFCLGKYILEESLKLPLILYSSESLVSLKLTCGISFKSLSPIHFQYLKILHLEIDERVNNDCTSQLISGCPFLEGMYLEKDDGEPIQLPYDLLISKTLASLQLFGKISFHGPSLVHLPRLKIFHLDTTQTVHDEVLSNLLSGYPLLEDILFGCYKFFEPMKLPYNLFISKTLVSMKLKGNISFHIPSSVHLPRLKILHLGKVATANDEFLGDLLSGCPDLQEMHIRATKWTKNVSICLPRLEHLNIELRPSYPFGYKLEIIAPGLKYLNVCCRKEFNGETAWDLPNLMEAFVYVFNQAPRELLSTVRNTKVLILNRVSYGDRQLPVGNDIFPRFQNLESLEIRDSVNLGCYLLEILKNSDNLQKLIIDRKPYDSDVSWSPPQLVPHCLLHTLKAFSIECFSGLKGEMQMVNYILTTARVLEKVTVRFLIPDADQKLRVKEKLSAIHRCSIASKLVLI